MYYVYICLWLSGASMVLVLSVAIHRPHLLLFVAIHRPYLLLFVASHRPYLLLFVAISK